MYYAWRVRIIRVIIIRVDRIHRRRCSKYRPHIWTRRYQIYRTWKSTVRKRNGKEIAPNNISFSRFIRIVFATTCRYQLAIGMLIVFCACFVLSLRLIWNQFISFLSSFSSSFFLLLLLLVFSLFLSLFFARGDKVSSRIYSGVSYRFWFSSISAYRP